MVAVVSMNTIMKKNKPMTAVSATDEPRKKPFVPMTPHSSGEHDFPIEDRGAGPERGVPSRWHGSVEPIAPPEREAVGPKAQTAERVDHEVHRERVRGVLGAAHPRFDHREAGLHEHDEEARDERPDHVDGEHVVRDPVVKIGGRERARRVPPCRHPPGSPIRLRRLPVGSATLAAFLFRSFPKSTRAMVGPPTPTPPGRTPPVEGQRPPRSSASRRTPTSPP